jgi:hypothetical protein
MDLRKFLLARIAEEEDAAGSVTYQAGEVTYQSAPDRRTAGDLWIGDDGNRYVWNGAVWELYQADAWSSYGDPLVVTYEATARRLPADVRAAIEVAATDPETEH